MIRLKRILGFIAALNDIMAFNADCILLTGTANPELAAKIGRILRTRVYNPIGKFADGETRVKIPVNVRKRDVFIIQSTCPPKVDTYFIELLLMIDAARRASANRIIAVVPYMGYTRQDRKEGPRVPISSALLHSLLEKAGADSISVIDLHSDPQQGFVSVPVDNLYGSYTLVPKLKSLHLNNLIIASPDKGGVPRTAAYAKFLGAQGIAIVYKERDLSTVNTSEALEMIGDVKGKVVLLVDDMIDTAGTLCHAAELIKKRGAKRILAAATHGLFSPPAVEKLEKSGIEKVYVTDTIPLQSDAKQLHKVHPVSVAPLLAEAIKRIHTGESISGKLILKG